MSATNSASGAVKRREDFMQSCFRKRIVLRRIVPYQFDTKFWRGAKPLRQLLDAVVHSPFFFWS